MANINFTSDAVGVQKYFVRNLSSRSNNKYIVFRNLKGDNNVIFKEYFEIYEKEFFDAWRACRFHFEIRWNANLPLRETKTIRVVAHVEDPANSKMPQITAQIRLMFSKKEGDNIIIKETVNVDFSTEESTLQSIQEILNVLESTEYRNIAAKVNALL